MAKRYSGNATISVIYDDSARGVSGGGFYRVTIAVRWTGVRGGRHAWSGIVNPAPAGFGPGIAYDSPEAYDSIACSAVAFAQADGADLSPDYSDKGIAIRRS